MFIDTFGGPGLESMEGVYFLFIYVFIYLFICFQKGVEIIKSAKGLGRHKKLIRVLCF